MYTLQPLRGVRNKTRCEVMDLIKKLLTRVPQPAIPDRSIVEESAEPPGDQPAAPLSVRSYLQEVHYLSEGHGFSAGRRFRSPR
jgi:hypothetical protein